MRGTQIVRSQLDGVSGAVVVVDVLRAFTTAAYAFGAGAESIYLVSGIDDALTFKANHPEVLAMGEDHGKRPDGFDFSNSPAALAEANIGGRTLVQRTSAGTQGVVGATAADRLWAASLVCASATATAVEDAGLGAPTYVITGCQPDAAETTGLDDRLTAALIERARCGEPLDIGPTSAALGETLEAKRSLALGPDHCHPTDIKLAAQVDTFDFAMEVVQDNRGLRLRAVPQPSRST